MKYFVRLYNEHYAAGDIVCLYSCCQTFIRATGHTVYVADHEDLVKAYNDDRFRYGNDGVYFVVSAFNHRGKESLGHYNYLGTYMSAMGLLREPYPSLNLPTFDISSGVERKALIQPFSSFAENPPLEYVQGLVDTFIEHTGMKLYVVGRSDTPRTLKGVDYSLLKDSISNTMEMVQNAVCVLTPRSLTAHLAAGYKVPCFVWCPSDGENWHLDYKNWLNKRIEFKQGLSRLKHELVEFLKERNIGTHSSVGRALP